MTPEDSKAVELPKAVKAKGELARLIEACGRDERPALRALYDKTAPALYGLARNAGLEPDKAEAALLGTYAKAFAQAKSFDAAADDPVAWLHANLASEVPTVGVKTLAKPLQPPAELWHKLDIRVGLERLDRHIKPGVAKAERGRDPMPNAYDRSIERQLAFWRTTAGIAITALVLWVTASFALALRQGDDRPSVAEQSRGQATRLTTARADAGAESDFLGPRTATLRPAGERRLWQVELDQRQLSVRADPAYEYKGRSVLALWASAGPDDQPQLLGPVDPSLTSLLELPDDLASRSLELFITLEPADAPQNPGRPVFSGRLER